MKSLIVLLFLVPISASANYICNCYTDLRYLGQGLVLQGQANSPALESGSYYCNVAYRGATYASCSKDSSYRQSNSSSSSKESDCVYMPFGIAEACVKAFAGEENPNPSQIQLQQDQCVKTAISIDVVKSCLQQFPLDRSPNRGEPTSDRANCIYELSSRSGQRRCSM